MKTIALLVFCFFSLSQAHPDLLTVDEEIAQTPATIDFAQFIPKLPTLARKLRVASPCVGIHGSAYAFDSMGTACDYNNIYDLEQGYLALLLKHLRESGIPHLVSVY